MLLLALTCERVRTTDEHLVKLLMNGELVGALRIGFQRLERTAQAGELEQRALIGQLLSRALLAADRPEDAEELAQKQVKIYESISRQSVRWMASLDQGALAMHMGRFGRAAEVLEQVADDESAPVDLRVEAMAGIAAALHRLGEPRRAGSVLRTARRVAEEAGLDGQAVVLHALEIELGARARLYGCAGLSDYALNIAEPRGADDMPQDLCDVLRTRAADLPGHTLLPRTLEALRVLLSGEVNTAAGRSFLMAEQKWLRDRGFNGLECTLRMDTAMTLLANNDARGATEALGALMHNERSPQRQRIALEMMYCHSRLQALEGRHDEALRSYKEFAREALYRNSRERSYLPHLRFLEHRELPEEGDAAMQRLPLRYRRAYRFIIEHLDDSSLSIKQVAAHVDVTERALQMAFRKHLGLTPAEFIRQRRMEGIRRDLRESAGREGVLQTASRWGLSNRSTLAHGYRRCFAETPTGTLRGA